MAQRKLKPGTLLEFYTEFKTNEAYYVDKTLFIEHVLENPNKVQLYTRPRRFGKTMSLTTFHAFVASHDFLGNPFDPNPYFEGKKILSCDDTILSHMGKHPVIFMSLKECNLPNFKDSLGQYSATFSMILKNHQKLIEQVINTDDEREIYQNLLRRKADFASNT